MPTIPDPPALGAVEADSPDGQHVPRALRTVAAWSWRILVIIGLAVVVLYLVVRLEVLFVAIFVALLLTSLLHPPTRFLRRRGWPSALATALVLISFLGLVTLALYLAGRSFAHQSGQLIAAVKDGFDKIVVWSEETFGLSLDQINERFNSVTDSLGGGEGSSQVINHVFGAASTVLEIVSGMGIAFFATIFFVHDGEGIWNWVTRLFPRSARGHVDEAGRLSWNTLASYAHGTVTIAAIDAVGIALGAFLIGLPLAGPIGVLVFFSSFVPIVGALLSGMVAVLIALATLGIGGALLMLAIVIGVQQLEGHVLQPLIQGRFVAIHPLAIVLAVAGGSLIGGIVGAVIAVPIVAVINVLVRYAAATARGEDPVEEVLEGQVDPGSKAGLEDVDAG